MHFQELLDSKKFLVISELQPPKGTDLTEFYDYAEKMRGRIDAVNVPDLQSAVMRLGSLSASYLLKEKGFTTICNMTCRDRNRLALQSDLLNISVLGIENIVVSRGEEPSLGDHPDAKPVFDLTPLKLISAIRDLQKGYDMAKSDLHGTPKFCVGSTVNSSAQRGALDLEIKKMEEEIRAGVDFFLTTSVFELDIFENFIRKIEYLKVPIIPGIMILKSVGMARFMNKHVEDVFVPEVLIERLMKSADKPKTSVEIASELINGLKPLCQGVHLIPFGWEDKVPSIIEKAGLY